MVTFVNYNILDELLQCELLSGTEATEPYITLDNITSRFMMQLKFPSSLGFDKTTKYKLNKMIQPVVSFYVGLL